MNTIISAAAFMGTVISFASAVFVFVSNQKIRRMRTINQRMEPYIKNKFFLLMKNGGENPCEIKKKFSMPSFSQECDYIVRRNSL